MEKIELIIKYSGVIDYIQDELDIVIEKLSYGYAIVVLSIDLIEKLKTYPEIEYIEEPRRLYFSVNEAKEISCINAVQRNMVNDSYNNLYGEGTIIAIIDSGIDYNHNDFKKDDGSSRIYRLWDQTVEGNPPEGFIIGTEYTNEEINRALSFENISEQQEIVKSVDLSGHGTHVAGIACGNGRESNGRYVGVAPLSEMIIVKIGDSIGDAYPYTSRLMEALEYVIRLSVKRNKPVAINLSFGNNYGDHKGNSLLELFINNIALTWKNNICVGAGNEANKRIHVGGELDKDIKRIELVIGTNQNYVSMQIWKELKDDIILVIETPNGERLVINENREATIYEFENYNIDVYYGRTTPLNISQEINIILYPKGNYLMSGIWVLEISPKSITEGRYDIWLGSDIMTSENTGFVESDAYNTLTIPSTSYRVITVGAYNGENDTYASFSGRGTFEYYRLGKPDIVAPGVDIISTRAGGGYESRTGTSMATPLVTGSVALMHEWGIKNGNDENFYGEKVKAYLRKGARILNDNDKYPNSLVGWGALCLRESIPM